MLLKQLQE